MNGKTESHRREKFMKQKLLEIVQVNVPNFFLFDELPKMRELGAKNMPNCTKMGKLEKNACFWLIALSFLGFCQKEKKL